MKNWLLFVSTNENFVAFLFILMKTCLQAADIKGKAMAVQPRPKKLEVRRKPGTLRINEPTSQQSSQPSSQQSSQPSSQPRVPQHCVFNLAAYKEALNAKKGPSI